MPRYKPASAIVVSAVDFLLFWHHLAFESFFFARDFASDLAIDRNSREYSAFIKRIRQKLH